MKTILTTILAVLLLIGCGQPTATAPDIEQPEPDSQPDHFLAFWDDQQPPGWMPDGTYMQHIHDADGNHIDDSLVVYFAAHFTEVLTPEGAPEICKIYKFWYWFFDVVDERVYVMVRWYETNRCDIPMELDIEPPC